MTVFGISLLFFGGGRVEPAKASLQEEPTFFFYINGDSDLSLGKNTFQEIKSELKNEALTGALYFDPQGTSLSSSFLFYEKGQLIFKEDLGETDSASVSTLLTLFERLETALGSKAAGYFQNLFLVVWGHGEGWLPVKRADFSHPASEFDPVLFSQGLEDFQNQSHFGPFSGIIFDSCLMGTLEVSTLFEPSFKFLMASEQLVPGDGLRYQGLGALVHSSSSPREFLLKWRNTSNQKLSSSSLLEVAFSVYDLEKLGPLLSELEGLRKVAPLYFKESYVLWNRSLQQQAWAIPYLDLSSWIEAFPAGIPESALIVKIQGLLQEFVFPGMGSNGQKTGVSLYYPSDLLLLLDRAEFQRYSQLEINSRLDWASFLEARRKWVEGSNP